MYQQCNVFLKYPLFVQQKLFDPHSQLLPPSLDFDFWWFSNGFRMITIFPVPRELGPLFSIVCYIVLSVKCTRLTILRAYHGQSISHDTYPYGTTAYHFHEDLLKVGVLKPVDDRIDYAVR